LNKRKFQSDFVGQKNDLVKSTICQNISTKKIKKDNYDQPEPEKLSVSKMSEENLSPVQLKRYDSMRKEKYQFERENDVIQQLKEQRKLWLKNKEKECADEMIEEKQNFKKTNEEALVSSGPGDDDEILSPDDLKVIEIRRELSPEKNDIEISGDKIVSEIKENAIKDKNRFMMKRQDLTQQNDSSITDKIMSFGTSVLSVFMDEKTIHNIVSKVTTKAAPQVAAKVLAKTFKYGMNIYDVYKNNPFNMAYKKAIYTGEYIAICMIGVLNLFNNNTINFATFS